LDSDRGIIVFTEGIVPDEVFAIELGEILKMHFVPQQLIESPYSSSQDLYLIKRCHP
jgi:hypothetical protein